MNKKSRQTLAVFFLLCSTSFLPLAQAAPPLDTGLKDTDALRDLKLAKGVFMLDVKEPGKMAHILKVVEETRQGMAKQNVKPELVVVVVGPSVAFLTKDRRGISYMDERAVSEIQDIVTKLKSMGVRTEACGVALKGMDVHPDALIPEVTPVGNGYISAIGYQMQGYQLIPVY